jgi:DNA topoisomerase-3
MLKPLLSMPTLKDETQAVLNNPALLKEVGDNKSYVDDKKVSDHYAITPTGIVPDFAKLTQDEKNIYETVAKRFLAIFLPPEITDRTTIVTESNGLSFRTSGKIVKDPGYTRIYNKQSKDVVLPNVLKGDVYDVVDVHLNQGKTKPPQRYTDKTLGSIMENVARLVENDEMKLILKEKKGLGTPATRGSIVEKLVQLKMMERKKKNFFATDYGISIILSLQGQDIIQPELTATWESKLADVEKGKLSKSQFHQEMLAYIREETEKLTKMKTSIVGGVSGGKGGTAPKEIGTCPSCGGKVLEGKNYFRCERYKNGCDFILGKTFFNAKLTATEVKKLLNGKETKELSMSNGQKEWKAKLIFDTNQKKVVFASNKGGSRDGSGGGANTNTSPIGTCSTCGGNVRETGNYFLCENYKDKCHTCIPKSVNGVTLTKADVVKLLKGEWLEPKEFTWKSGKKSKAQIRFADKIEYDFSR